MQDILTLSQMKDDIQQIALQENTIGKTNMDLLKAVFPLEEQFTLSNVILSDFNLNDKRLEFSANLNTWLPWGEIESKLPWWQVDASFTIFDLEVDGEEQRHLVFTFIIPSTEDNTGAPESTDKAYIFLTQYILDSGEELADSNELAPDIPVTQIVEDIAFGDAATKRVMIFSTFDYVADGSDNVLFVEESSDGIVSSAVEAGLNFPLQIGFSDDIVQILQELLQVDYGGLADCRANIKIIDEIPYFKLSKARAVNLSIDPLELQLSQIDLTVPLLQDADELPDISLSGQININDQQNSEESLSFDIVSNLRTFSRTLSFAISNFPSLDKLMSVFNINSDIQTNLPALSSIELSELHILLDLTEKSISSLYLNMDSDIDLDLITLSADKTIRIIPTLTLQIDNPFDAVNRDISGELAGIWTFAEKSFNTSLTFPDNALSVTLAEGENLALETFLPEIGQADLKISQFQILGDFGQKSVDAYMKIIGNPPWEFILNDTRFKLLDTGIEVNYRDRSSTITIYALMTIGNAPFYLSADYSEGLSIEAGSMPDATLEISALAENLMAGLELPKGSPGNFGLTNISFFASPKNGEYSLRGQVEPSSNEQTEQTPSDQTQENWKFTDIVQIIQFSIEKSQNTLNGTLVVTLPIRWLDETTQQEHEIELRLSADNSTSEGNIWQFEGSSGGTQPIPIDDLVRWIGGKFSTDAWLPTEVQGIDVTDLSLMFTSDGRFFKFTCAAEITINDVFVPISLDINLEKDNTDKFSKQFGGTIEIEGLLLDLKFSNKAGESILIGSLAQAEDHVIPLSQLATNFLPVDLISDLPDLDITPNNVVIAYQKQTGASPVLFTLDMGGGQVDTLGGLPLVGEYLKEYDVSIDYRIALASADVSNEQVTSINEVLPDGFTKLPAAPGENLPAIGGGFNVLASINLAGAPLQLTSGNGNGGAAEAGSTSGESPANGNTGSSAAESNVTWVSLQRSVGPLYFSQVGFRYHDGRAAFLLDVSLTIAGLTFSLQGLAISSPLTVFLPKLELAGFGLGYQSGPLEISGIFMRVDNGNEFSGAAIIKAQTFSLTAYGAYSELAGDPSMFLYAILDKVLGGPSFFYVTGLALGFGYNRDVIVPAIEHVADFPLVAAARQPVAVENPLAAAAAILDDLKNSVTTQIGAYWVAAGVRFSSFQLIDSFALLLVKFGRELDIVLMGISTLRLPKDKSLPPYLYAELQFKVSVRPAAGVIKAEAQLTDNSYLIDPEASLRGGFAFYAWFAGPHNGDFVLSLGGYHPRFTVPSHYPQNVPAITINWPLPQYNLSIKGTAYFALTPSSIMAGGTLQAVYDSGAIWASFTARADFLINWKPFFYDISLHLMLQVRATLDTLFGPISAETSLSANLHLWGPEFAGTAHVEWYFVSFDIAFGDADRPTHRFLEWPEFRDAFLPKPESDTASPDSGEITFARLPICRLNISSGLVAEIKNEDEVEWVVNPEELMLATETFIPATEVSLQASRDDVATVMSGADIGFRPLGSGAVRSTHQITIRDSESGQVLNLVDDWTWAPDGRRQGMPAELWHTVNTEKEPAPSADILANRLVGLNGLRPRVKMPSQKATPVLELLTFKFDPLPEKYLPLSIGTDLAPVFKVSEETDPFHFTEDLAAIPSSLEKIKETAQTDLVNTNRLAVLKAARAAGFALETDGSLEILVETVETTFQSPPMLGFVGSTGIRQRTVDPAKRLPLDEPPPSLRETAVRLVALLYQYKYAAAARISDTVMGGHVVPPDPHSDKVTFRKAAEDSGPEAVTAVSVTSAPAQKLAVGQSQTWQLESEDPNKALKTAIVLENSRGQRVRIVSLDRYGRLLNDETVDGRANSIRHDLDRQTAHLLLTGLPGPEAVSGPESESTSNQTVGWNSASTLIQMQPRLFVGDEVLVRSQASRRRRQAGDSGVDLIEGLAAVNQNLHIDSRGDLTSGWLRTFLPAGNDLQTLAIALRRSELAAPARPNSVVQVVRENGDSLQLKPIFIVRESEVELILLYSLPGDLRLEKGKTHVVFTETTAGWQIDGVMGIRERPGRVRANWSQYRLQPDVTRTAAETDLIAQVALVLNE